MESHSRFENALLSHRNFKDQVRTWWTDGEFQGWEGYKFMQKLKETKKKVSIWNKEVFGDMGVRFKELSNKIKQLDGIEAGGLLSEVLNQERKDFRCELETLSFRNFQIQSQKAKVKWLKKEDQNSKFFHSLLDNRRNIALIDKVELEDGSVVTDEKQIEQEILKFYGNLFRKSDVDGGSFDDVGRGLNGLEWCPIQSVDAAELEKPVVEGGD
ncbi:uncharacterized protein LOC142537457 [Primulina tabacum]|uniref:uncharacterized protein LOC142537457 n=1 Tax=Primulina tabacum TaxID=48773 RepID=UPI003F5AD47C